MKRIALPLACLLALFCASLASGQTVNSGSITSTQCVSIDITQRSTVGIHIEGTWTGTLQPSVAMPGSSATKDNIQVTPGTSSTAQSTITANGFYQARIAGAATFFLCGNTVASGTAAVTVYASSGVSAGSGGGGSAAFSAITGGTNSSAAMLVGTGASLGSSGTGTISATNVAIPTTLTPENFGAVGDGSTNDCAAFTTASASNTDIYTTSGHSYAISGNCTITGQVNIVNSAPTTQVPFIVKPGAVLTFNQPPNNGGAAIPMFTLQTTTSVADTLQRANENPLSDGGAWVVGTYATGLTAEAGQIVGNLYEMQTASAAKVGYVLWNANGAIGANQISTITAKTNASASTNVCAAVRGAAANAGQYRICVTTALGNTGQVQLAKTTSAGSSSALVTCSPASGVLSGDKISISATGTSTTVLTGYLNGAPISACTFSDSSTPITSGLPGMIVFSNGTIANAQISAWSGATFDAGIVLFNANTTSALPEWFGAKGDGLTTTDDSVAIQACVNSIAAKGECFLAPKTYNILNTVYMNTGLTALRGAPVGAYGPVLQTPSSTMNLIQLQGVSGGAIQYNVLQDFTVERTVTGTGLGTGVYSNWTQWTHIARVNSFDSTRGFYWEGNNANSFSDDLIVFNTHGAPSGQVGYTYNGAQNSSRNRDSVYIGSGTGMALLSAVDLYVAGFESSGSSPGLNISGNVGNLKIQRPVLDACTTCVTISSSGHAELMDIYAAGGAASTTTVGLAGATGTHIIGGVVNCTGASATCVGVTASSKNILVSGLRITPNVAGNTDAGLVLSSTTDSIFTNNQIVGTTMGTGISVASSPNNVICGNNVSGSGTNGISIDAASSPNAPCSNNVDPASITNPFVGAGIIPVISSGFGTSPSVVAGSQGPQSFTINVGTGAAASTGIIGLPAARHGWSCTCADITTSSSTVFACKQTGAGSTTTAPIGQFTAAGAAQNWAASDILTVSCQPY